MHTTNSNPRKAEQDEAELAEVFAMLDELEKMLDDLLLSDVVIQAYSEYTQ